MTDALSGSLRDRYARQLRVSRVGEDGQRRLLASRVAVLGCGALGASQADLLARAGVGMLRLIDRDLVELSNLHRQRLYDAADAAESRPKAAAAAERLRAVVDPSVTIEPVVADVTGRNIDGLLDGVDLVMDGTDNFETRFVLNDACLRRGLPWVHAAVVGTAGQAMAFVPGETACYACYLRTPPPPGSYDTCDTAGVLGPAVDLVASVAAMEALKLLLGRSDERVDGLTVIDAWGPRIDRLRIRPRPDCPACAGQYIWLRPDATREAERLCGRDAVQLPPREGAPADLERLQVRLKAFGDVRLVDGILRFRGPDCELLLFADGRAIVRGTDSTERARSLYARYIG